MRPTLTLVTFCFCLFAISLSAQQLPKSNVYLFDMKMDFDSTFKFTNPTYLTNFNSEGYNNQPFFMNDNELYLTVQMADDTTQTDIYSLNFKTGVKTQVTDTPESEYSPTLKIGSGGMDEAPFFTCIRVATDEEKTQRLWQYPLDRSNSGKLLFEDITDIGYHAWFSSNEALLFIVGSPHRLMTANERTGNMRNIGDNIGRCLKRADNGTVYYVRKLSEESWYLRALTPLIKKTISITETLPGVEDFAVLEDGSILMGQGSKLFRWTKDNGKGWIEIADFGNYGISNISRIAIRNGKYLALVSD